MSKIQKIYDKLISRLPKNYDVGIRIYRTTKDIIRYIARKRGESFQECYQYYQDYIDNPKTNTYLKCDKYYSRRVSKITTPLDFSAFSGQPILMSNQVNGYKINDIIFLLLHEIGHQIIISFEDEEKKADLFAIRWVRKLRKEGYIK